MKQTGQRLRITVETVRNLTMVGGGSGTTTTLTLTTCQCIPQSEGHCHLPTLDGCS